jgi:hypothetical protein
MYSSFSGRSWFKPLYACALEKHVEVVVVASPDEADLQLRLGEPAALISPAYQIDLEEILIVTHPDGPYQDLTLEEVRLLFAGQADPAAQIWVYAAEEDLQQAFDRLVMQGRAITSQARVAATPDQMLESLSAQPEAVGILPGHWPRGSLRQVFTAGTVPVLAMTRAEPTGALKELISCLQD